MQQRTVPSERRALCRRVVGAELLSRAVALEHAPLDRPQETIRLYETLEEVLELGDVPIDVKSVYG